MYIGLYSTSGGGSIGSDRVVTSRDSTFPFSLLEFCFWSHPVFRFFQVEIIFCKNDQTNRSAYCDTLCIHWDSPMSSLEEVKNDPFLGQFWTSSKTTLSEVLSQNGFQTTPQNDPKKGLNGGSQSDPFMGHFSSALLDLFTRGFEPKRVPKQTPKRGRKHLIEENSVI